MLSIPVEKIDSLFELLSSKGPLYIPVKDNTGKSNFQKWEKNTKMSTW